LFVTRLKEHSLETCFELSSNFGSFQASGKGPSQATLKRKELGMIPQRLKGQPQQIDGWKNAVKTATELYYRETGKTPKRLQRSRLETETETSSNHSQLQADKAKDKDKYSSSKDK